MGSRAGIPNKNKQALIALLEAKYPGYHPVMELAKIANDDVKCTVCAGTGKVNEFTGTAILDSGEIDKHTTKQCEHCINGYTPVTMDMKFNANKEVAQYVTPKLKAIEHTGDIDHDIHFTWDK